MRTRREFLKGMGAILICGVFAGCGGSTGGGAAAAKPDVPSGGEPEKPSDTPSEDKPSDSTGEEPSAPADDVPAPDNNVPNLDAYRKEVLRLVNEERAKAGVSALEMDDAQLLDAAQVRAKELTELFSHTRPDGTDCFTALTERKINAWSAGENIAAGQQTPAAVVESWMNSPGHRANILSTNFTKLGVGYYYKVGTTYRHYWVQMFTD